MSEKLMKLYHYKFKKTIHKDGCEKIYSRYKLLGGNLQIDCTT